MKSSNRDLNTTHYTIPCVSVTSPPSTPLSSMFHLSSRLTSPPFSHFSSNPSSPSLSYPHLSTQVLPLVGALTEKLTLCSETISIRRYLFINSSTVIRVQAHYLSSFIPMRWNLIVWCLSRLFLITIHSSLLPCLRPLYDLRSQSISHLKFMILIS